MDDVVLHVVRHGETSDNRKRLLSGHNDVGLTKLGIRQARALKPSLKILDLASIRSSDMTRCLETARHAGFTPEVDLRWRELDFGSLAGLRFDQCPPETQADLVEFDSFVAPHGETVADLIDRVRNAVEGLPVGHHLVFTHGGPIRVLLRSTGDDRLIEPGSVLHLDRSDIVWDRVH